MDTDRLKSLVDRAWKIYEKFAGCDYCVKDSIPILYFGDLQKYKSSPIRIITVALNPSHHEFPKDSPKTRFKSAESLFGVKWSPNESSYDTYVGALNKYFEDDPYSRWFNDGYKSILCGLSASFSGSAKNTALHTDLCSPLATNPTWSRLKSDQRRSLTASGFQLRRDLVDELKPDVVLVSIRKDYLCELYPECALDWIEATHVELSKPYAVKTSTRLIPCGKTTLFVFGQASRTPFGRIGKKDKVKFGAWIATEVNRSTPFS